MKIWVDDIRPAPDGYIQCESVEATERLIEFIEKNRKQEKIELLDLDHDAGDFFSHGGDYIKILDWMEETGRRYPIHIHSMNPVGVFKMKLIIEKNHWKEV